MTSSLHCKTDRELLALYSDVMSALRARGVVRSSNGPAADYAESLAARALRLTLNVRSTAGHDGVSIAGQRIEVKCRRLTPYNRSRQLSAIRGLDKKRFDHLAGILFEADFSVIRGALVPYAVVKRQAVYVKHTNSWRFILRDSVWNLPGVRDITKQLQRAQASGRRARSSKRTLALTRVGVS